MEHEQFLANDLVIYLPVWEEGVWSALQDKKFADAAENLQNVLEYFTDDGLKLVFWKGLIEGIPAARGIITPEEWRAGFLPYLAAVFINFSDGDIIADTYERLDAGVLVEFHKLVADTVPANSPEEKIKIIKDVSPTSYKYFVASPSRALWINIHSKDGAKDAGDGKKPIKQLAFASRELKRLIFSFDTAESVFLLCKSKEFTETEMGAVARITGLFMLGIVSADGLTPEIKGVVRGQDENVDFLCENIREKIAGKYLDEIKNIFEGTKKSSMERGSGISLEVFGFNAPDTRETSFIKINQENNKAGGDAPLIIHAEKSSSVNVPGGGSRKSSPPSSPFGGFSRAMGFFKSKTSQKIIPPPVKAVVQVPGEETKKIDYYGSARQAAIPFAKKSGIFDDARTPTKETARRAAVVSLIAGSGAKEKNERENIRAKIFSISESVRQKDAEKPPIASNLLKTRAKTEKNNFPANKTAARGTGFFTPLNKNTSKTTAAAKDVDKKKQASFEPRVEGNTLDLRT